MQLRTWCTFFRSAPSFTADFYRKTSPSKLSLKENKVEKVSGSGLTFEDLQTEYSRLGNEGLIAILAQPPSSSPMIAIRTSDHHGSNFSYNSHVLRRKHLSFFNWRDITVIIIINGFNNGFRSFRRNHIFSVAVCLCACGRDGSRLYFAHTTPNNACFSDFCDVSAIN